MTKTRGIPPVGPEDGYEFDPISPEEEAQAEVGSLFTIQGERFADVQWSIHRYRTRQEIHDDPAGEKTEWVADVTGELRGQDLVSLIGGGTFNFRGYVPRPAPHNGVKLAYNRTIRLAGPRRDFAALPPPPPPIASLPGANGTTAAEARMDRLERLMEKLIERPVGAAAPASSMKEMIEGLVALDTLRGRGAAAVSPDMAIVTTLMGLYTKGVEDGREREPIPAAEGEGTVGTLLKIFETAAPVVGKMLDRIAAQPPRRAAPAAKPAAPGAAEPHEASVAEVVVEKPEDVMAKARMMVMVERLSTAIRDQEEIEDAADAVALLIPESDLVAILSHPDQAVIEYLASNASGQFPNLASEQGKSYLIALLAELRKPDENEEIQTG